MCDIICGFKQALTVFALSNLNTIDLSINQINNLENDFPVGGTYPKQHKPVGVLSEDRVMET